MENHPIKVKYRGKTIWGLPLSFGIRMVVKTMVIKKTREKEITIERGGLIIPRTEFRKGGIIKPINNYYPGVYSALRSRVHLIEKERQDVERLENAQLVTDVVQSELSQQRQLTRGKKLAVYNRLRAALRRLPKTPRDEKKAQAQKQLTIALSSKDQSGRNNPSARMARITAAAKRLNQKQENIVGTIIAVNLLRQNALENYLRRMEYYLAKIKKSLEASQRSWLGFSNRATPQQFDNFAVHLKNLRNELLHIQLLPHAAEIPKIRAVFELAIEAASARQVTDLAAALDNLITIIKAILDGSLNDKGSQ